MMFCNFAKNNSVSEEKITHKQRKLKVEKLLKDIESGDIKKISPALDALQVYGDSSVIQPLFDIIGQDTDETVKNEIQEFLSSLKDSSAKETVIGILRGASQEEQIIRILSTIWNSPLDYSSYVADFVKAAVRGNFMVALECLTILENLEGPFEEEALMESQLLLKEYHEQKDKDGQKHHMMSEIAILIKDFDKNTVD